MSRTSRPSLPSSCSDFDLPSSSTHSPNGDISPIMLRLRRPSLLAPKSYYPEGRLHSPLADSSIIPMSRKGSQNGTSEAESESDRERIWTDSSTSSENVTPSLPSVRSESESGTDNDNVMKTNSSRRLSTPPRAVDVPELSKGLHLRRLPFPLKQPRILSLQAEPKPEENEVKSEAQFQRLLASCSVNPAQPKTPRGTSDSGRYPEEAGDEEAQREDTPSDDGDEDPTFAYAPPLSEPLSFSKPVTPAHSVNGDEMWMDSPGVAMDVDSQIGSPSISSSLSQWRYTPPPTTSAVRTNKRKLEDRFDPYPTSAKRRAVSPSISHLRDHPLLLSPILGGSRTSGTPSRTPMPIPISIPNSSTSSLASSPTISQPIAMPRSNALGSASIASSPTMRSSMALSSPIMRAMSRRRGEEDRREVEGAGEGVGGLRLQ
ncbi:hypothetical protein NEOLEDRAFT_1159854 [Neolentinus lepideus HHB14362 ss-1]|uniref:Uncharacterized protein n=1 Tax=Neolentinus lepideus HHB14362 ss-1 TaxID=1314782 RepID=A0A165W6E7_9AGAM|nr:hypothetical protein NEOLEDRAFT_1159854 [Neolentinus lepideus HHB14362 ss-1]